MTKFFPRRLSFPKICDILIGYLNTGADQDYVGVSETVVRSNVSLHNISRNNNFLKSWNFIEESKQESGKYKLSREAAEFAYAYRIDPRGKRTRAILRKFLSMNSILEDFVERITNEDLTRDAILIELPRVIGDLRADKVGINAFVDMIAYAFQIQGILSKSKTVKTSRESRIKTKVAIQSPLYVQKPENLSRIPILSINLTISPQTSPEKLKEYLKALLEAYKEFN